MSEETAKKPRRRTAGFILSTVIGFGLLLLLMLLVSARAFAFVVLAVMAALLIGARNRPFWHGWRIPLCWLCALAICLGAAVLSRPDASVSFVATVQREGMRFVFGYLRGMDNYYDIAVRYVASEPDWKPPGGYTHQVEALSGSTMEYVQAGEASGKIIYQLHGGAYLIPLANTYRNLAVRLSEHADGADVALLDYRIAPEHVFPGALRDAREGWDALLAQGYSAADILVVGDSAGGNLALALCLALRDEGRDLPCGIIAISPWADLAGQGGSYTYNLYNDPTFGIALGEAIERAGVPTTYAGETALTEPYLSPVYGEYHDFPPMLLTVGGYELMESDSLTIYEKARAAGVDARLIDAHGMFHVYPLTYFLPESRAAWSAMEAFIADVF